MTPVIIVDNPARWRFDVPGVEVVAARDYLTHPAFAERPELRAFNLCRTYGYQTLGYYVSLLADARGHRPLPSVTTMTDLRLSAIVRVVSEDAFALMQRSLSRITSDKFTLSIYFGRNTAEKYDELSRILFNHFPAPLLRATFVKKDTWRLDSVRAVGAGEVPKSHEDFVVEQARRYFAGRHGPRTKKSYRYSMAIHTNPDEGTPPSDRGALDRFMVAARKHGIDAEVTTADDAGRIAEYDALFIRETTSVDHITYRLARRAEAEGMVVVDDPKSIVRATNKVYLAEAFARRRLAHPKTLVVAEDDVERVERELGYPCVLKQPDSSFSLGVVKAHDRQELEKHLDTFFEESELVVAQAWTPSEFDWRVGVLGGKPLYACRYGMAKGHWQIAKLDKDGRRSFGKVQTLAIEEAPAEAVKLACRAAAVVGKGLYGVDIKEIDGRFLVIEVNDNPTLEKDVEDRVIGDELYGAVMRYFVEQLEKRASTTSGPAGVVPVSPEGASSPK